MVPKSSSWSRSWHRIWRETGCYRKWKWRFWQHRGQGHTGFCGSQPILQLQVPRELIWSQELIREDKKSRTWPCGMRKISCHLKGWKGTYGSKQSKKSKHHKKGSCECYVKYIEQNCFIYFQCHSAVHSALVDGWMVSLNSAPRDNHCGPLN